MIPEFNQSKPDKIGVPSRLIIQGYLYLFKDKLKGNRFSYKCKSRRCGVLLGVTRSELDKLYNGAGEFIFTLSKEHTCLRLIPKTSFIDNILPEKIKDEKGKSVVALALYKDLYWHIKNLKDLEIFLPNRNIINIIKEEREKKFPIDEVFLLNISNIKIDLVINNLLMRDYQFCYEYNRIINQDKQNREERYLILTSKIQMEKFILSKKIYIDINYKVCPNEYKQTLTLIAYDENNKAHIPSFVIPMSFKSKLLYDEIFQSVLNVLKDNGYIFDTKNKIFVCDFDDKLRETIINYFPGCVFKGCFFHYMKNIWKKAKIFGLLNKNIVENTKKMMQGLEFLPFIKNPKLDSYIKDIKYYLKILPLNYLSLFDKFLSYFEETWIKNHFLPFEEICKEDYENRQVNIAEYFHWKMSLSFEYYFPKMASFVEKVKQTIGSYYNNINMDPNEKKIRNTFEDIYKFIEEYKNENMKEFKFDTLFELNNDDIIKVENIIINNIKCFFGLVNIEGVEDENVLKNIYDYDFIEEILPSKYKLNDFDKEIVIKNMKEMEENENNINFEEISNNVQNDEIDYLMSQEN